MSAQKPRAAYCTGCDVTFPKMHILINHRRQKRCGGRFLPKLERDYYDRVRLARERALREERIDDQRSKKFHRTGSLN